MGNMLDESQDGRCIGELPVTSENIGFAPEEMNACVKCGRTNSPARPTCFYCSANLEIFLASGERGTLISRELEIWEKGFNVVYLPQENAAEPDIAAAARFVSIEAVALRKVTNAASAFPIARLESAADAEKTVEYLSGCGMKCSVVPDEILRSDTLPKRLRSVRFAGNAVFLTTFNINEEIEFRGDDVVLIVAGAVFEAKTETIEKRKKKESSVVLETQSESKGGLIDIYVSGDSAGYRIPITGFDFSCLGTQKSILAAENIQRLAVVFRNFAARAKFAGDYAAVRKLLDHVWPLGRRRDSYGGQAKGFGGKDFTNIETTNNLQQFTKYSRLQRQLL